MPRPVNLQQMLEAALATGQQKRPQAHSAQGQVIAETQSCILSVIGSHAGESVQQIFQRKIEDTRRVRRTFWLFRSRVCKPDTVRNLCGKKSRKCYFLEPASRSGATPTKANHVAREYSRDRRSWLSFESGLSPVTGNLTKDRATALVLGSITLAASPMVIDLNGFTDVWTGDPVMPIQGASTICADPRDDHLPANLRQITAIAELVDPFCVWVR